MGYNNNHAGIHWVSGNYIRKTDESAPLDKYGAIIAENNLKKKRKVSCRDCKYYNDDQSCEKEPVYIPEVRYDNWKYCKSFLLSQFAKDFDEKEKIVIRVRSKNYIEPEQSNELSRQTMASVTAPRNKKDEPIHAATGNNSFNYWNIPSNILNQYRRYAYGDQRDYIQCKSRIPKQMYESFKRYCIERKTDSLDQSCCELIKNLKAYPPDAKGVKKFREALIGEIFKLLFMKPSNYNLSAGNFNRLFTDAFVELLKKKKCFDR